MKLHIVVNIAGGFAREDAETANALGVYTDPILAEQLRKLWGFSAKVCTVELNAIPPGLQSMATELGVKLNIPEKAAK